VSSSILRDNLPAVRSFRKKPIQVSQAFPGKRPPITMKTSTLIWEIFLILATRPFLWGIHLLCEGMHSCPYCHIWYITVTCHTAVISASNFNKTIFRLLSISLFGPEHHHCQLQPVCHSSRTPASSASMVESLTISRVINTSRRIVTTTIKRTPTILTRTPQQTLIIIRLEGPIVVVSLSYL